MVSVYRKDAIRELAEVLHALDIEIVSTGGSLDYIRNMGVPATSVEDITGFPSILGGRVKTLHPSIFGSLLCRPGQESDEQDIKQYGLNPFDMVVVDLYPFEQTLAEGASHDQVIEQIDIGGISLIRAAAKNYQHVLVVPDADYAWHAAQLLRKQDGMTTLEDRRYMAAAAMDTSSHYDAAIFNYLRTNEHGGLKVSIRKSLPLRYGENPHQQASYYGDLEAIFDQISGKPLSYNNLLDIDAAIDLMSEFTDPAFAIIKHTNACGVASRESIEDAWTGALAGDPVSAFGGILIANRHIGEALAAKIDDLFYEVLIAPSFDSSAVDLLSKKKKRVILRSNPFVRSGARFRSLLNGVLWQTTDQGTVRPDQWQKVTVKIPDMQQERDLMFANTVVKHLKSNAVALVRDRMLIGAGFGQTSRVDAVQQAIMKARAFKHELKGAVMASDAFFPFADCVEIADKEGITAVVQPGGSVRDRESIDYCNNAGMSMVLTGQRHFKH